MAVSISSDVKHVWFLKLFVKFCSTIGLEMHRATLRIFASLFETFEITEKFDCVVSVESRDEVEKFLFNLVSCSNVDLQNKYWI